jgi:hypothetical protein
MTGSDIAYVRWREGAEAGLNDATDFMDECHLTPEGARKFTNVVIGQLAALGWLENGRVDMARLSLSKTIGPDR